jgi:hypothetical protein
MPLHSQNTNYILPLNPEDTTSQWHVIKSCLRLEQALKIGKGTEEYNEMSSHNQ